MPKKPIKKWELNVWAFKECLKDNGYSYEKIAKAINCNEKTIRRAVKDEYINPKILERIAKVIDIDPRVLTYESLGLNFENQVLYPSIAPLFKEYGIVLNVEDVDSYAWYCFYKDFCSAIVPVLKKHFGTLHEL